MGVETENYEIAAKGFENTDFVVCILVVRVSREILPVGYLKGRYKSESSLMTCVAELHGSVIRMPCSILSHIGTQQHHAFYRNKGRPQNRGTERSKQPSESRAFIFKEQTHSRIAGQRYSRGPPGIG